MTLKDIEELKKDIKRCVRKHKVFDESEVTDLVLECLERKYKRRKAIDSLKEIVRESIAKEIIDEIFTHYVDHGHKDDHYERKRKHESKTEERSAKKIKTEEGSAEKIKTEPCVTETKPTLQDFKSQCQMKIDSLMLKNVVSRLNSSLTCQTNPTDASVTGNTVATSNLTGAALLSLIDTEKIKSDLMKEKQKKKLKNEEPDNTFFDPNIKLKTAERVKREIKFVEPGTYLAKAEQERYKAQYEIKKAEISEGVKKTGISTAAALAMIQPAQICFDITPDVEWWDVPILTESKYPKPLDLLADLPLPINYTKMTNIVCIPKIKKAEVKRIEFETILTKRETKKLRRQNREEKNKQKQENIRLGIEPPPEPKLRLSSLNRILCSEMVSEPTKTESYVKGQVAKRIKDHEDANAARKLTAEQRKEKKDKKIREDTTGKVEVCVYRVRKLSHKNTFKVKKTADKLHMTGIVVIHSDCNVVVTEGGPNQHRKFKRLMMIRIKWNKDDDDDIDDDDDDDDAIRNDSEENGYNYCKIIWEGEVKSRAFGEMAVKNCQIDSYAMNIFKKHSVEHYWDSAYRSYLMEKISCNA